MPLLKAAMENTQILHDYSHIYNTLREKYLDYPSTVSIETYAFCNAACHFCPYHSLGRKGIKMPTEIFEKIINDLKAIPKELPFDINLSRVNEPFCDKRIFEFISFINHVLPQCHLIFFSNGSLLHKDNITKLSMVGNIKILHLSFNDHRPEYYEKVMQLPYEQTFQNLQHLHDMKAAGKIVFSINMKRVGDKTVIDQEFVEWSRKTFPLFSCSITEQFTWLGQHNRSIHEGPDVGCLQWFKLHILADGRNAFCCIDEEGCFGHDHVRDTHILNLYNNPAKRRIRTHVTSRRELELCARCHLLG